ncbi:hypothetical protein CTI12_AA119050 [Artemisia annua]|uniref:Uncharacterized protein n=1 Tax=Artemisia annua TaxID=35608 RepID=A0A2U1PRU6_ARTAN|nr:hypothetical protein CTI12_AA119050 [Artemisia annua]
MTEELMVCRSDSFYIGQKIPPLEQHDRLQPGHTYFLLPSHLFHSVLSFVTIASFTSSSSKQHQDVHVAADDSKMKAAFLKKAAASSCSPFDIQKTPSGTLRIRVSELFISQLMMDQASSSSKGDHLVNLDTSTTLAADLLCTTPQLHKEYKQLVVGSRRGWKPKLEMIKETPPSKGGINKRKATAIGFAFKGHESFHVYAICIFHVTALKLKIDFRKSNYIDQFLGVTKSFIPRHFSHT